MAMRMITFLILVTGAREAGISEQSERKVPAEQAGKAWKIRLLIVNVSAKFISNIFQNI